MLGSRPSDPEHFSGGRGHSASRMLGVDKNGEGGGKWELECDFRSGRREAEQTWQMGGRDKGLISRD